MKLFLLFFAAATASADGLADLRAALARFPAQSPLHATVTFEKHHQDNDHPTPEHGKVSVDVESGADGVRVLYASDVVARAQAEDRAQQADPEKQAPTAYALRDIRVLKLVDALNAAGALARTLTNATLQKDQRITVAGRPLRQLTFLVKPAFSKADAQHVTKAEMTLVVIADSENVPVSAEFNRSVKARFMLIGFEQTMHVTWMYTRAADRLVAVQYREEQAAAGLGQNFSEWTATGVLIR